MNEVSSPDATQSATLPWVARAYAKATAVGLLAVNAFAALANATLTLPTGFLPTDHVAASLAVLVSFAAATAVYAALARFTQRPRRNFIVAGIAVTLVSLVGPLTGQIEAQFPGAGTSGAAAAIAIHIVAAVPALALIDRA